MRNEVPVMWMVSCLRHIVVGNPIGASSQGGREDEDAIASSSRKRIYTQPACECVVTVAGGKSRGPFHLRCLALRQGIASFGG